MSGQSVMMRRDEEISARLSGIRQAARDWRLLDTIGAILLLGLATVSMLATRAYLDALNIAFVLLLLIVLISLFADRWTSIASSLIAFLIFDFFFILPYYTFDIAAVDHILALVVFLAVAALTSQLVYRIRVRTAEALERGRQMSILFELSQALIADVTAAGILNSVVERAADVLGTESCAILMVDKQRQLTVQAAVRPPPPLDDRAHIAVATWAVEQGRPAGLGQQRYRTIRPHGTRQPQAAVALLPARTGASLYVPIAISKRVIGLLYINHTDARRRISDDDQKLLSTFANQIALALERGRLTEEATRAAVLARSDNLKSALLSAVSHDLRTPLASIKASATSLLQPEIDWSPEDQQDLLLAINEETDRLTRLVENLLDLSRIEAGEFVPRLEWNDPDEVIRETARRAQSALPDHTFCLDLPDDLPLVLFDYLEIGQVLFNLFENAGKYAPPGTTIDVAARYAAGELECSVADRGPGIAAGEEEQIFDKFYRIERRGGPSGAGIGLSICRGIIEAHRGRIWVEPREGGGAVFRFTLPVKPHTFTQEGQ